jgi:hypothetical protein
LKYYRWRYHLIRAADKPADIRNRDAPRQSALAGDFSQIGI